MEDDDRAQVAREGRNGHRKESSDYGKAWRTMIGRQGYDNHRNVCEYIR